MHVRNTDMPGFEIARAVGTILIVAIIVFMATPPAAHAQTTPPENSATTGTTPSVLDRIRKKMREANAPENRARKWFDTLDLDRNEEITKEELFQSIRRRFDNMDKSGDKFVSKSEYLDLRPDKQVGTRRFGELDANADGRLSMAEFASPANWRFDRIDRNLDGKVSRPEAERLFDRPVGTASQQETGECFYVERQVVRVKEDVAEAFRRRGYPKADCAWTPDVSDESEARKFTN